MSEIDPRQLGEALSRIPLFKEMQRLLMTQEGPVNWEIARQIARAVAEAGGPGTSPEPGEREEFEEECRLAELRLVHATGLEPLSPVTDVQVLGRAEWADLNLEGLRPLIDRLAARLQGQIGGDQPVATVLDAVGPFLLGVQVGFLVGYLARRVLGQYDLCFPVARAGRVLFVAPNIAEVAGELEVDIRPFRLWLALHEITHHLEFTAVGWSRAHFTGLVEAYVEAAALDPNEILSRLGGLADPERITQLMEHPEELLPMLTNPAQQGIAEKIQAFMSVLEGYAEWAMDAAGRDLLPELERMREGISRRRVERSSVERLLEALLGLDLKHEQYRAGERFVRTVTSAGQMALVWERPDNLPSLEEVREPATWLSRVAFS